MSVTVFVVFVVTVFVSDAVGAAHWCDDGHSELDLQPTNDIDRLLATLEQVLTPISPTTSHQRSGERALQETLQKIVDATRSFTPEHMPVLLFLYGDYSAMPRQEADHFLNELLQTSAIVYGLKDSRSPEIREIEWLGGEKAEIANYLSTQTGGTYLSVTPQTYSDGLKRILEQLHVRYELGFSPAVLDGKRHNLRVELRQRGEKGNADGLLKYRLAYFAPSRKTP